MKVKVHDWNLPANERIILPLTEHNYYLNFIGFLIKPLPSALTCSTTVVNLFPRTDICFSPSTSVAKFLLASWLSAKSREPAPFHLCSYGSFFPFQWQLLTINLLCAGPCHMSFTHPRPVGTPESCPGLFKLGMDQNIWQMISWGNTL